jgi:SsrA-binding protein
MPTFAKNKKAYHEYQILEEFEAGISLRGHEVKAIKTGRISIKGSYARIQDGEIYLIGASIPPYQPFNTPESYNDQRKRKLLLKKKQIQYLSSRIEKKGLTIVPLKVYSIKGKVKIKIGLAKGKRKFDKRQKIKERAAKREMDRRKKKFNQ